MPCAAIACLKSKLHIALCTCHRRLQVHEHLLLCAGAVQSWDGITARVIRHCTATAPCLCTFKNTAPKLHHPCTVPCASLHAHFPRRQTNCSCVLGHQHSKDFGVLHGVLHQCCCRLHLALRIAQCHRVSVLGFPVHDDEADVVL